MREEAFNFLGFCLVSFMIPLPLYPRFFFTSGREWVLCWYLFFVSID